MAYKQDLSVLGTGNQSNTTMTAFLAFVNTTIPDVTGDGTEYTVIYDTEVFDQGSNFNLATSVFTAPTTGRYAIQVGSDISGTGTLTAMFCRLVTSNRTYRISMSLAEGVATIGSVYFSILADMDVGDTFTITDTATDSGGKVVDVLGTISSLVRNWVSANFVS